jgi:catechol 2,3-dioxygenase-like lactoylglutathione lyase family enzyme
VFDRLHHVGIIVRDAEAAAHFYGRVLGLPRLWAARLHRNAKADRTFDVPGADVRCAWYQAGRGGIETFAFAGPWVPRNPEGRAYAGWRVITLDVPDLDAAREAMTGRRVRTSETFADPGARWFYVSDPDGNRLRLRQTGAGGDARAAHSFAVLGLAAVGRVAADPGAADRYARDVLGGVPAGDRAVPEEEARYALGIGRAVTMRAYAVGREGTIEVYGADALPAAVPEHRDFQRPGIGHAALAFRGLKAFHSRMADDGIDFLAPPWRVPPGLFTIAYFRDPEGVEMEAYDAPEWVDRVLGRVGAWKARHTRGK